MTAYLTKQGDMVDSIAFNFYGSVLGGQVEAVVEANRSLDLGQYVTLPAGMTIMLPEVQAQTSEVVRLFA